MCIFASVENYIILQKDQTQLSYDMIESFNFSSVLSKSIKDHDFKHFYHIFINSLYGNYPPVIILQAIPFYFIFGHNQDIASFSNCIYIFILAYSIYFFGKKIFNKDVGFLAATFSFFVISLRAFSRVYFPAFPLTSFFMLSLTLYLYTNTFKKINFSRLFGLSLGIGMLIKVTYFIYITPIILFHFIYNLFKIKFKLEQSQIKNLIRTLVYFSIPMLTWYPANFSKLIKLNGIVHKQATIAITYNELIVSIINIQD